MSPSPKLNTLLSAGARVSSALQLRVFQTGTVVRTPTLAVIYTFQ